MQEDWLRWRQEKVSEPRDTHIDTHARLLLTMMMNDLDLSCCSYNITHNTLTDTLTHTN